MYHYNQQSPSLIIIRIVNTRIHPLHNILAPYKILSQHSNVQIRINIDSSVAYKLCFGICLMRNKCFCVNVFHDNYIKILKVDNSLYNYKIKFLE